MNTETSGGAARRIRRHPSAAAAAMPPRRAVVARVLAAKRAAHPELAGAPTLEELLVIAERDDIFIHEATARVTWLALASGFPGCMGISMRRGLTDRVRRVVLAHELAHCWLHFSDVAFMERFVANRGDPRLRQRCEDEADLLAAELLQLPFEIVEAVTRSARDAA